MLKVTTNPYTVSKRKKTADHPNARRNDLTALTKLLHPLERELCPQFVDRVSWARSRAWNMIKFVVKPTNRGWAIYQEGAFVGEYPTRRAAMDALAKKRQKLKVSGQRSSIKFEPRG